MSETEDIYNAAVRDALAALGDDEPDDPAELQRRAEAAHAIMQRAMRAIASQGSQC
jgi:hypothetical protein